MVTLEVVSLMQGKWSYYRGSHFNGARVMLWRWPVNGTGMVMLERV